MKKLIAAAFALTMLGTAAAEAQVNIHIGGRGHHYRPVHHRHQVCTYRHHHRSCYWR